MQTRASRRTFLKVAGASVFAGGIAPAIHGAEDKAGNKPVIIGEGEFQYECQHGWGELPDSIRWSDTHGTAVDKDGLVYITHRGNKTSPCDTVVVFDPDGKMVRSFGKEFAGGGHGIDIRDEDGTEYVYLSNTGLKSVVKCTKDGEVVWSKQTPEEPHLYDDPDPKQVAAAKEKGASPPVKRNYSPTNVCFGPNGDLYIGDGYGSSYIHQYDKDGKWIRSWGGSGSEAGKLKTPHGQWLDARSGEPRLVIADRANARLQYFSLDGQPLEVLQGIPVAHKEKDGEKWKLAGSGNLEIPETMVYGISFPADIDIQGDLMLVPDLHARLILFNKENQVIANLGLDEEWTAHVLDGFKVRRNPDQWPNGKFIHPHDACFDADGNIYVAEWVAQGRISRLKKV